MYFITHRHKQQCSVGQREGGWGWVEAGREGNNGDTCNSVDNKNKAKIIHILILEISPRMCYNTL